MPLELAPGQVLNCPFTASLSAATAAQGGMLYAKAYMTDGSSITSNPVNIWPTASAGSGSASSSTVVSG